MDDLVKEAGGAGKFQVMMTAALKVGMMPIAWSMMQMAFAGLVPDWWCLPADDLGRYGDHRGNWTRDNATFQVCTVPGGEQACEDHITFDESVKTVVNEWSLVCDLSYVKPLMTTLQMVGVLLGAFLGGQSSDTIGRRLTVYLSSLVHVIACVVAAFSVSWQMFMAMRVVIGVTLGVFLVASFSYPLEFVNPKWRQVVASIPGWNAGVSVFALMAWLVPDWSYLHIGSAVMGVPFLLTWFFIPESARWLAAKGRLEEAEAVVERVARVNGRPKPNDTLSRLRAVAEEERQAGQGRRYTYLDVYRGWRMAFTTLVLNFVWFSLSFSYYGISFGVSALSGNVYLNIFLMTIVEIPSNFSTIFFANSRLGRRWTSLIFFFLCSVSSFGILIANKFAPEDTQGDITTGLAMVSKLSVGSAWLAVLTFTSELYPTVIRNLGYGASNTMSRVGGALAPVLLNMDTTEEVVRGYIVVGSLMAASGLACLLLRETKGQGLEDSIATKRVKDEEKDQVKAGWPSQSDVTGSGKLPVWTVNGDKEKMAEFQNGSSNGFVSVRL
ncbi:hypothetical protein BaRGS_00032724 [Batillaria attramentaria]|uniref:Major facilitator superfamily (MFS) profile domain-containing protein n=1 Tax=Batillaria attramentaria TaxID=370345 RepID=A0ABD0JM03_9CAEN